MTASKIHTADKIQQLLSFLVLWTRLASCQGKTKGRSRISGKEVHMYKGVGVRLADFISFFLNIP